MEKFKKHLTPNVIFILVFLLITIPICIVCLNILLDDGSAPATSRAETSEESKAKVTVSVPDIIIEDKTGDKDKGKDTSGADSADESVTMDISGAESTASDGTEGSTSENNSDDEQMEVSEPSVVSEGTQDVSQADTVSEPEESRVTENPGSSGGDPDNPFYQGGDNPFAGDVSNNIIETSEVTTDLSNGVAF